jgi:hypothetical protein
MTTPLRQLADRYVDIVNRGAYHELQHLFADDAVFYAPGQRVLHGSGEIATFYQEFLPTITPQIRLATYVESGNHCVYELEAKLAGTTEWIMGAIDHATVNAEGKITRFAVYTK